MRNMCARLLVALFSGVFCSAATAGTLATFADPTGTLGTPPLFVQNGAPLGTLSGDWNQPGLTLITPINAGVYSDVTFHMDPVAVGAGGVLGPGYIEFRDNAQQLLLGITFDSGLLNVVGFGGTFIAGHDVTFSGPLITSPLADEAFAFSFANPLAGPSGLSWTASFTSSATPEPAALAAVLLSAVFMRRR